MIDDLVNERIAVICRNAAEYEEVDDLLRRESEVNFANCGAVGNNEARENPFYFISNKCPNYAVSLAGAQRVRQTIKDAIPFAEFMETVRIEAEPEEDVDLSCEDIGSIL